MKNKYELFRFKKFSVRHSCSSMKVGVDGVFVGAWASLSAGKVLDVGCGCGVISLMIAQRMPNTEITAIDIHAPSVEEAKANFMVSPWAERLTATLCSFNSFCEELKRRGEKVDLIVSNPPYFDSGVKQLDDPRKLARHQGELSPESLLRNSVEILSPGGKLTMVIPDTILNDVMMAARNSGMVATRQLSISHHEGAPAKRILLEFEKHDDSEKMDAKGENLSVIKIDNLTMFQPSGEPTDKYRTLCGDFYLKF